MTNIFKKVTLDGFFKGASDTFNGLVVAGLLAFGVHAADAKAATPAAPQQVVEPAQQ
ncbi:MAG TPA: hypothetical protein PLO23_05030 [Alphaproteobacteria bacterium]|nr:hypothetical protein [Alphaproteobacteria bacterium]